MVIVEVRITIYMNLRLPEKFRALSAPTFRSGIIGEHFICAPFTTKFGKNSNFEE